MQTNTITYEATSDFFIEISRGKYNETKTFKIGDRYKLFNMEHGSISLGIPYSKSSCISYDGCLGNGYEIANICSVTAAQVYGKKIYG